MTKLLQLFDEQGQSPWLDNLTRADLRYGTLARYVASGVGGVTANPTIFAKAIEGSDVYGEQFGALIREGCTVRDAYWRLVIDDIVDALRPTFAASGGTDGFVSIEVAPELARDPDATITETRGLHRRAALCVDMEDVGFTLEDHGVAGFHDSFAPVLAALVTKARQLATR